MVKRKYVDSLDYIQPTNYIVSSENYSDNYDIPVLTAGQSFLLGYTNDIEGIYPASKENPIILFDDFTTAIKWVDFPFKVKSSACKILVPKKNSNLKFLYYSMFKQKFDNSLHKRYWISEYSQLLFPDYENKDLIVKCLDSFNDCINLKKNELLKYDELIKSRFIEMFGDVVLNTKKLKVCKLKDVAEIGSSKRIYASEYVSSGIPFYRSKEVIELGNNLKPSVELFITEERYKEVKEKYGVPQIGDILMTAVGTIGKFWVVDTENPFYYKDGNLVYIRARNFNSNFFKFSLETLVENYKQSNANGAAYAALTIEKLKEMDIVVPSKEQQNAFDEFYKQIDKSKLIVQKQIEKLQELLDKKMEEYFG